MFSIAEQLENVRQSIQKATKAAGRPDGAVTLLPVSKRKGPDILAKAFYSGCRCFGENYLSEALHKQEALAQILGDKAQEIEWHFIGPIQSNKTKSIAENFAWVQSIDREKIAHRLNKQRPVGLAPLNVCIQVNIDEEYTKSGILSADVSDFADFVNNLENLSLRGLMCIPSAKAGERALMLSMQRMHTAFKQLQCRYPSVDTLSMGMSADQETAIFNGSTMVRVGTAIFGARS
jgi:hypothetical protein